MPSPSTQLNVYWLEFRYKEEMQLVSRGNAKCKAPTLLMLKGSENKNMKI